MFTAPPVLIGDISVLKVAAQLGNKSSFSVMIYSTSPVSVDLQRTRLDIANESDSRTIKYFSSITSSQVQLKVFDTTVTSDGLLALTNFTVNTTEEFGEYNLFVNNSIGFANRTVLITAEGVYFDLYCTLQLHLTLPCFVFDVSNL